MEILGHRGWLGTDHLENSTAAADAALRAGADGVEVDVRLTGDGVAVCCHDADLQRTLGVARGLRSLTFGQLRTVAPSVPTLREMAMTVAGRGRLVLDLKPEQRRAHLVRAGLEALEGTGCERSLTLSSFDAHVLQAARALSPGTARALIVCPDASDVLGDVRRAQERGDEAVHLPLRTALLEPDVVREARARGLVVRVWTVNRSVDVRLLTVLDVQSVVTDVPDQLVNGLRRPALALA